MKHPISFNHNSSYRFPICYLLLEIRRLPGCSETRNLFLLQINYIRNKTNKQKPHTHQKKTLLLELSTSLPIKLSKVEATRRPSPESVGISIYKMPSCGQELKSASQSYSSFSSPSLTVVQAIVSLDDTTEN